MTSLSVAPLTWSDTSLAASAASSANSLNGTSDSSFSSFFQNASNTSDSTGDSSTQAQAAAPTDRSRRDDKPNDKRQHTAKTNDNAATLLGAELPSQVILDDRKLKLSLDRAASGNATAAASGTTAVDSTKLAQNKANNAAQNKGGVAFGANLHMNATQVSDSSTNKGTQAIADTKNNGKKEHGESGKDDEQPAGKNPIEIGSTNVSTAVSTHAASAAPPVAPVASIDHVQTAYAANAASKPVEAAPVMSSAPVMDAPSPARDSKTIDFQVASADDNAVNVRVSQRAGDVQVTVRTPDSELAQSLRQHLPELSDRLSQSGVQGDLWQPSTASATNDQSSDTSSGEGSQEGQAAFSDAQSNQQKQQEKNQSAWLNQMYEGEPNR